jgi:hypothetical protein
VKKKIFYILYFISMSLFAQANVSDISSMPGAFSRMGFGARGMGMGNALSAVTEGDLVAYYNPALSVFQQGNSFSSSYSILALDRSLNFINFTRRFDFGQKTNPDGSTSPRSTAGISIGLINSGVSNIDARDDEGTKTGSLSTSENLFFAAIANRFSQKLSIGFTFKFYYYKLYQGITSTSLGFDVGALYQFNKSLTVSLMVSDINSKYQWDTGSLYGQDGIISKDYFPLLKKIGFAYKFNESKIIASVEFENSNGGTNILRGGAEYNIYENFFLRAGFDQLNLSNYDFPVRPSCGFSYFYSLNTIKFGVNYAFVIEPYSSSSQHIVGININF